MGDEIIGCENNEGGKVMEIWHSQGRINRLSAIFLGVYANALIVASHEGERKHVCFGRGGQK